MGSAINGPKFIEFIRFFSPKIEYSIIFSFFYSLKNPRNVESEIYRWISSETYPLEVIVCLHRDVRYTVTRYMQITEPTKKFTSTYRLLLTMPLFHSDKSKGTWVKYFPENRGKIC